MRLSNLDRRVLATLKASILGRQYPGLRIAVLGNCQSFGIGYAIKVLNPAVTVHQFPLQTKPKITGSMLIRALQTYDHVFLQDFHKGYLRGVFSDVLREKLARPLWYPTLLFAAYHPDSIFIQDRANSEAFVCGPLGQHHSAIALFAYRAGMWVEDALRLYDREVFETLGYFDLWEAASAQFLTHTRSYSFDLGADFLRWTRRGCFMYTINHPKPRVLFDMARHLLDKAAIPAQAVEFDDYAMDDLARDAVFPIYPEIAEHYEIAGGYVFKGAQYAPGGIDMGGFWDLPGFVRESYRVYAHHRPEDLANDRVQGWLDDPEISAFLKGFSRRTTAPRRC
jgi:Polysaccharide biosynthesis enzyme WcbI